MPVQKTTLFDYPWPNAPSWPPAGWTPNPGNQAIWQAPGVVSLTSPPALDNDESFQNDAIGDLSFGSMWISLKVQSATGTLFQIGWVDDQFVFNNWLLLSVNIALAPAGDYSVYNAVNTFAGNFGRALVAGDVVEIQVEMTGANQLTYRVYLNAVLVNTFVDNAPTLFPMKFYFEYNNAGSSPIAWGELQGGLLTFIPTHKAISGGRLPMP